MSSGLSNEQHADRGLQEGARGVLADNTGTNRPPKTKKESSQFGREATNAGETTQGGSSRSDHWSCTAEAHMSLRQDDADDEKNPPEAQNEIAVEAAEGEGDLSQVGAMFSPLEGKRMGEKQTREQNSRTIDTSTTQSAGPPTRRADSKSPKMGHCSEPKSESGSPR